MKKIMISLLCLLLIDKLYSQVDSSAESFFPHHVGDVWNYDNVNSQYQIILTKDSISQGCSFLYYNNGEVPYYMIDSSLNVIQYPTIPYWTKLLYKLKAGLKEWWISEDTTSDRPTTRIIGRVDAIGWGKVFDDATQFKEIGYYYQPISDTTLFSAWRNSRYIAAGFGYYLSVPELSPPDEQLIGCIIEGIKYGTLTSVKNVFVHSILSSYKLYPAFPNPFNPSTVISYQLPKASNVSLKVYDILGREVTTLVNKEQQKGNHKIYFELNHLTSGIYFVRMSAGSFIQTIKIIYSK